MPTLTLDFETRSEANLLKVGPWAYSEHPSTEIICACWQLDGQSVGAWANPAVLTEYVATEPRLIDMAHDPAIKFEAHNTGFEYSIWMNVGVARYGWPVVPVDRWRDTMAVACYYALPAALDPLCRVLGLPGKNPEGKRLIDRYSKLHSKTARRDIPPEDQHAWWLYCGQDVEQEVRVAELLGELPEQEELFYQHDFAVAVRGLNLDLAGISRARVVVDKRSGELE